MSHSRSSRSCRGVWGFTLIELLVVVAIIALLVSILLPSLSRAREQAKAAVCASRLRSFGQASSLYQFEFGTFAPCDPWALMPFQPPDAPGAPRRNPDEPRERVDPAHGWLALHGLRIKPVIREPSGSDVYDPWERYAYGFRLQSLFNPEDLWEGFFCPSQNRRNTMSVDSPELDATHNHEGYPVIYKYASGYIVNRMLRSPAPDLAGNSVRASRNLSPPPAGNIFGSCYAYVDAGEGMKAYVAQAVSEDELAAPAETLYLCDSLDYHAGRPDTVTIDPFDGPGAYASAGMWYLQRGGQPPLALLLGARHLGKANVLYADSHVSSDGVVPRNKRGSLVIASTFADYVESPRIGNQFHAIPTWRSFEIE